MNCPECGSLMRGNKCKCGNVAKFEDNEAAKAAYIQTKRLADEKHLHECRKWLYKHGIIKPGMTTVEELMSCSAYREKIRNEPQQQGLDWARKIMQSVADGDNVSLYAQRLAEDALK